MVRNIAVDAPSRSEVEEMGADSGEWYWCMEHSRAEDAAGACAPDKRLGPYRSKEEATHWKDKVEARNEQWEKEDRRWEGEDE